MYIKNGIVYAGQPQPQPQVKVSGVRPLADYKLWVRFNNGEAKIFDCKELLDTPAFSPLRDEAVFRAVYIDYGMTMWQDGDIPRNISMKKGSRRNMPPSREKGLLCRTLT